MPREMRERFLYSLCDVYLFDFHTYVISYSHVAKDEQARLRRNGDIVKGGNRTTDKSSG